MKTAVFDVKDKFETIDHIESEWVDHKNPDPNQAWFETEPINF